MADGTLHERHDSHIDEKSRTTVTLRTGGTTPTQYRELIDKYRNRYPAIKTLDEFYDREQRFKPRLCVLGFPSTGNEPTVKCCDDVDALKNYWQNDTATGKGRLYILEDLSNAFVEALGMHFKLDPTVFVAYLYTPDWDLEDNRPAIRPLPSARKDKTFYSIKYYDIIRFDGDPPDKRKHRIQTAANIAREISTATSQHQVTGLVRRNALFWYRPHENGDGWDALTIVDPNVGESLQVTLWGGHEDAKTLKRFNTSSYLHGYVDFSVWPSDPENQNDGTTNGPPRKSLLDDIVYYWKHVSTEEQRSELKGQPAAAALYMNKIIASNWVVMLEHLSATLSNLEHHLWILEDMSRERNTGSVIRAFERSIDIFRPLLARGNIWRRRLWWYLEDMRWNMEAVKAFLKQNPGLEEFQDALDDFTTVKDRMEECRNRIDSLMRTVIGAGNLLVSQNSSNQAESASRISGLAVAFIPFSFASSLFAMIDPYSPGNTYFWIYWVVSIGLILIVITVIYGLKWWSQRVYRYSSHILQRERTKPVEL